jgi:ABC-type nickel/cobalt efflux system permease component RcnA
MTGAGRLVRAAVGVGIVCVTWGMGAAAAGAHPLGLPAVAQITATEQHEVRIRWNAASDDVAALARSLGIAVPDGALLTREQDAELAASTRLRDSVLAHMSVRQDGAVCPAVLDPTPSVVTYGFTVRAQCAGPVADVDVSITLLHELDERYRTLGGATGPSGATNAMFTAAQPEHRLTLKPLASLQEPTGPGTEVVSDRPSSSAQRKVRPQTPGRGLGRAMWLEKPFVAAIDRRTGPLATFVGVLIALAVGAAHALAPGHGKTIAAAYLVGDRGRTRHAVIMGASVAAMHTGSVLVLGLALYSASRRPDTERLTSWIEVATGATFVLLGGWLLVRRWRERDATGHHDHDHEHEHEHEHPLSQDPINPASWRGVAALGAAGGLLPSPSALLVLLTALALGRVAYGLILIAAFSVGLAASLTLIGAAVVKGRDVIHTRAAGRVHDLLHAAPLLGAGMVLALGLFLFSRAVVGLA